jgi:oxalate decarboxylase/phosphoglucose isomerase-like protein (cupin superfamily)
MRAHCWIRRLAYFEQEGGWTRQTTIRELPTSVELAGVNMRLDEGVYRELHWHKEAEWAYVLDGEVRVTALDYEGGNFIDDLKKGDLWVSEFLCRPGTA